MSELHGDGPYTVGEVQEEAERLLSEAKAMTPLAPVRELVHVLTWAEIRSAATALADRQPDGILYVYGIPAGGVPVALLVAQRLNAVVVDRIEDPYHTLVVDDLVDSGRTLSPFVADHRTVDTLYRKPHSPAGIAPHALERTGWLRFPWEHDEGDPIDAVTRLLQFIGEDPNRDGLLDTPARVVKAMREMTAGYRDDISAILGKTFDVGGQRQELVVVRRIPFTSMCEHHMLPFVGHATVAYKPRDGGRIVGLSKLARLVHAYSRRLQVQERLTRQVVDALVEHLDPEWAGCVIDGQHSCMSLRGVGVDASMYTSAWSTDPIDATVLMDSWQSAVELQHRL